MSDVIGDNFIRAQLEAVQRLKEKRGLVIDDASDPIGWIERDFYIPETRGPIKLGAYQRACLQEVLTPDAKGFFPYSTIVWSDIKKSAKSTIAAAVGLWMAKRTPWSSVKVIANDLKQADSRVAYFMRRAIELNENLGKVYRVRPSSYVIELTNNSIIEAIPIDPSGEAGGNDDMIIFSELWGAHQKVQDRMWTEMTLSPTKYGKSFRWVETYAGFEGESTILRQLYEQGVYESEQVSFAEDPEISQTTFMGSHPLEAYVNKTTRLFCLWNTKPRMPWQTEGYYAQEASLLTPDEFRRVHRNEWASSSSRFIDLAWWDNCLDPELPAMQRTDPICLAADAGITSDCFALVGVTRHPKRKQDVAVRLSRVWVPDGAPLNFDDIEKEILDIKKTYPNIVDFSYDMYQLHHMMQRLEAKGWPTEQFSQTGLREKADKELYDRIVQMRIAHDGTHEDLRAHLGNANAKLTGEQGRLRIVKRSQRSKVDLAVALSMAASRCTELNLG